jgi:TonB family protein
VARSAATGSLPRVSRAPLTFVSLLPAPDPALVVPIQPFHAPPVNTKTPEPELVAPKLETPIAPEPASALKPPAPTPEPRLSKPAPPEPPRPAPPAVTVGAFGSPAPAAHTAAPVRPVQQAGFDAPAAQAPEIKTRTATAAVGAFDQAVPTARPQPGSDRPSVVADAGFGTMTATASSRPSSRAVADSGFGASSAQAPARTPPAQAVRATDFDAKPAPAPAAPAAKAEARVETPLEILSKPTPAYTDEARAMKIEGDVVLEVCFSAAGEVQVLRVVRGLGHGLDESATRAAKAMHFKPAQSAGRPVDFRTTVHIVFRLA